MSKKKSKEVGIDPAIVDLISRGAKLDKSIKKQKLELDAIKKDLRVLGAGSFATKDGASVSITIADVYSDPKPKEVYQWFKKNMSLKAFLQVIKVQVSAARTVMGESAFEETRKLTGESTYRFSFRKVKQVELKAKEVEKTMGSGKTRILKFKD